MRSSMVRARLQRIRLRWRFTVRMLLLYRVISSGWRGLRIRHWGMNGSLLMNRRREFHRQTRLVQFSLKIIRALMSSCWPWARRSMCWHIELGLHDHRMPRGLAQMLTADIRSRHRISMVMTVLLLLLFRIRSSHGREL